MEDIIDLGGWAKFGIGLVVAIIFAFLVLQKLERVVQVAERMDHRVAKMANALAPLGNEAVAKGIAAVESMNDAKIGAAGTEAISDGIGAASDAFKKKAQQWADRRKGKEIDDAGTE